MRVIAITLILLATAACNGDRGVSHTVSDTTQIDLSSIDAYLQTWDRFAQGDNSLAPKLKEIWPEARNALISALEAEDPRAPSRLVFLMLVQVGGSVPVSSETGRAWGEYVGKDFPVQKTDTGDAYFAPDFYSWWKAHQSSQYDLPLLREWLERDSAKKTVIPMYERLSHESPQ